MSNVTPHAEAAFLQRIGRTSAPKCSIDDLAVLQRAFMESIPFENLNVFLRRPLDLSFDALHEKLVTQKRGGYCFELNTYYEHMLRHFGFDVRRALARVWLRNPKQAPTRNHLTLVVTINDTKYLSDVGFGGLNARMPIPLNESIGSHDGEGLVRIRPDDVYGFMLEREVEQTWMPQYSFEHSAVTDQDVEAANFWMEQHHKSHFRENVFAARFTAQGRIGVFDQQITERVGAKTVKTESLTSLDDWLAFIKETLGLDLPNLSEDEKQRLVRKLQPK